MTTNEHSLQATLRGYFNGVGFERWAAIYGDTPVSRIRQTVREGHRTMIDTAQTWLLESTGSSDNHGETHPALFDAGCGTGLFSLAMAAHGFDVTGVDIAPRMIATATDAATRAGLAPQTTFRAGDVASVDDAFDAVACLDVLVHYPADNFGPLLVHLAGLTRGPLIITYAPYNRLLAGMHWAARFFPQGQRRTEIQMTPDRFVESVLNESGLTVKRTAHISRGFYHVKLLEASREKPNVMPR